MSNKSMLIKLRENERKIRHDLILESTCKLLEEEHFSDINVRKIAEHVGISPSSLYRYFSDRDDLFCEILIKKIDEFKSEITEKINTESISQEEIITILIDFLLNSESAFRILCYFLLERKVSGDASHKFFNFLSSLESEFGPDRNLSAEAQLVLTGSFCSSLIGTVIFYHNYPNALVVDKRKLIHKVAQKISSL